MTRTAMYYHAERKMDGMKALLSLAAIAAGLVLSNMAASPALHIGSGTVDVVGVWRWVQPGADGLTLDAASPTLEIRRAPDGELEATILVRSGNHLREADVSYDAGHLCMVTSGGASFKGQLSEDGSTIEGVLQYDGARSAAQLQRVERRKMRRAAERRPYAT